MELATPVQILSRADTVHPALRLRNRDDQALPLWADFGPIGGSSALFFLRTDLSQLFAGIAPPGLLSALAVGGGSGGASLARHFYDLRRIVLDDGNNRKAIVFSLTILVLVADEDGRLVTLHHEFKDLQAFELPPLMLLDESLAARAPDGTTTTALTPAAAAL